MKTENAIVIRTYTTRQAAEMAVLELASCGIEARIATDDAGGAYPFLDLTNGIAVLVDKSQEKEAKNILEEMNNKENVRSPMDEPLSNPKKTKYFLLGIPVGTIAASAGWWMNVHWHDNGTYIRKDRKEILHYNNGHVDWVMVDRDGDGKPDEWITYISDECREIKLDNNFDGVVDAKAIHKNGMVQEVQLDTDFNGVYDLREKYKNGVLTLLEVKPNGTNVVFKREIYQNGILNETWIDEDMDGMFDVKKVFDPMGKEVSVTRLTK